MPLRCNAENVFIRHAQVGLPRVVGSEDIIAQPAEFHHDIHWEVLVRVEFNHPHPHQGQQWRDTRLRLRPLRYRLLRSVARSMPRQPISQ